MRITANYNNYSNYGNYKNSYVAKNNKVSQNFMGGLSDENVNRVLAMLKEKTTSTKLINSMDEIKPSLDSLMKKWDAMGLSSGAAGVMVVPDAQLAEFMGEKVLDYPNFKDYVGVCIAVGDKYGPVEIWTKCYEANLLLVPKELVLI